MRWLALFASIAALGCAERPPVDIAEATWQELIRQLPEPSDEGRYDPTLEEWVYHPAVTEFATRLARGDRPSDTEWLDALQRSGALRWREVWPVDVPWTVSMRVPAWLGRAVVELHPRRTDFHYAHAGTLAPSHCGTCEAGAMGRAAQQAMGKVQLGDQTLEFDAYIAWGYSPYDDYFPQLADSGAIADWEAPLMLPVRGVATLAEALPPATGAALDAAVARAVSLSVADTHLRIVYSPGDEPLLRGLGVALDAEIRHDGELREYVGLDPLTHSIFLPLDDLAPSQQERRLAPETLALFTKPGALKFTARGKLDPRLLYDWDSDRHYAGSFELP